MRSIVGREGIGCAIRLPANSVLQECIGRLLTRPPTDEAACVPRQLPLSGAELDEAAPDGGPPVAAG